MFTRGKFTNQKNFKFTIFAFIDTDELNAVYLMSVLEEGLFGSSSWSNVWLSKDELDIMEYLQDFRVSLEIIIHVCDMNDKITIFTKTVLN